MYAKLYALPLGIIIAGFGFYYFVFDAFNQYQQHVITITQTEHMQNKENTTEEDIERMREELEKIKQSANVDFIYSTLAANLNRISSYSNIEFEDTKSSIQTTQKQEATSPKHNRSTIAEKKTDMIDYVPYRQIHTHELPNAFNSNLNAPTDIKLYDNTNYFDIKNTKKQNNNNIQWVVPTIKEAKIYHLTDTRSKVLAVNKNGIKMQVLEAKPSWVRVQYSIKGKSFIEGYMPTQNIRFVQ